MVIYISWYYVENFPQRILINCRVLIQSFTLTVCWYSFAIFIVVVVAILASLIIHSVHQIFFVQQEMVYYRYWLYTYYCLVSLLRSIWYLAGWWHVSIRHCVMLFVCALCLCWQHKSMHCTISSNPWLATPCAVAHKTCTVT